MTTAEENELLTRTGPGTVMGELMRQYWIPALRSEELPNPDCPPVRLRLLSENLVGFRTTSGKVGILEAYCPHRRTDLFLGRNEEEGLRCVFHGWKYDITGQCVDMPSEPPESSFASRVRAKAYPCVERGGVIWTYMGPRTTPPPLPELEGNMAPGCNNVSLQTFMYNCNWMQVLENGLDTVHTSFLHNGAVTLDSMGRSGGRNGNRSAQDTETATGGTEGLKYRLTNRYIRMIADDTEYGCRYGAYRPAEEDTYLWRLAAFVMPFFHLGPTNKLGLGSRMIAHVPLDDEHAMNWGFYLKQGSNEITDRLLPNTTDWLGRYRIAVGPDTDYGQDRELQRTDHTFRGYTGIPVFNDQDRAATELMGSIVDRTGEHLGGVDRMIIQIRHRLLNTALELRENGTVPPGVEDPEVYRQRAGWTILRREADVWEATEELRHSAVIDEVQPV